MTMHVFIHLANHVCNDQQPLLEIFFPEEATTIIGFIFSIIPPQVNELAMGKCMPENLGCWVGRSKRGQGKETVDGSGEHSVMIQGLEKTDASYGHCGDVISSCNTKCHWYLLDRD